MVLTIKEPKESGLELILLGTGTSSAVPSISCLVSIDKGCFCCRSTINNENKDYKKNIRRNTSAVLKIPPSLNDNDIDGKRSKTLLIDCGKTFYNGALEFWSKNGLKEIDGILITHPHSDAILGLDDLRGWTLHQSIQKSIDIYTNQFTYDEISRGFPYLCDSKKATGGGDVPALQWHIIDDSKPFTILGIRIVPLPVHHGKFFTTPPTPYYCSGYLFNSEIVYLSDVSFIPEEVWTILTSECTLPLEHQPPSCSISTLSLITGSVTPPTTPPLSPNGNENEIKSFEGLNLLNCINGHSHSHSHSHLNGNGSSTNGTSNGTSLVGGGGGSKIIKPKLKVLILDCLRIENHTSHFGIGQSIEAARRMGAERTYLVGFGHATSHTSWTHALTSFTNNIPTTLPILPNYPNRTPSPEFPWQNYEGTSTHGIEDIEVFKNHLLRAIECWEGGKKGGFWVRAGCDGLRILLKGEVGDDGDDEEGKKVWDDVYG